MNYEKQQYSGIKAFYEAGKAIVKTGLVLTGLCALLTTFGCDKNSYDKKPRREGVEKSFEKSPTDDNLVWLAKQEMKNIQLAINSFYIDHRTYPTTEELQKKLPGKYLRGEGNIVDPWSRPYQVNSDGMVFSTGPDGKPGTDDDVQYTSDWVF